MKVGRPDHTENHLIGNYEASMVDVVDLDVVFGDDRQSPDHHVPAGEGETDRVSGGGVLVEQRPERLRSGDSGSFRSVTGEDGPAGCGQTNVGGLARALDGDVVLAGRHDGAAKGVAAELNRDSVAAIHEFLRPIGEGETSLTMELGETLVLSSLLAPFPPCALAQLGGEIWIWVGSVLHVFALSTNTLSDQIG